MKIIRSTKKPTKNAVEQDKDIWVVQDGDDAIDDGSIDTTELKDLEARDAFPPRFDLSPSNPFYGKRAARRLISGQTDMVMSEDGKLEPATAEAIEIGDVIK